MKRIITNDKHFNNLNDSQPYSNKLENEKDFTLHIDIIEIERNSLD